MIDLCHAFHAFFCYTEPFDSLKFCWEIVRRFRPNLGTIKQVQPVRAGFAILIRSSLLRASSYRITLVMLEDYIKSLLPIPGVSLLATPSTHVVLGWTI